MIDYYSKDAVSQSMIKTFIKSKYLYKAIYIDKLTVGPDTEDMRFGRFQHSVYYEPLEVDKKYGFIPDSAVVEGNMGEFIKAYVSLPAENAYLLSGFKLPFERVWKDFTEGKNADKYQNYHKTLLAANGKEIVSQDWYHTANKMKDVYIRDNDVLKMAIREGWSIYREQEIFWKSNFSGLLLKSKIDCIYISPDFTKVIIEDSKGTNNYNIKEFIYTIKSFGYDIQQSFYKLAVQNWILEKFNVVIEYNNISFIFIPQRKVYPYNIIDFVELSYVDEDRAFNTWTKALTELEECITLNNWELNKSEYTNFRKIICL
jgi:hypothetical protein